MADQGSGLPDWERTYLEMMRGVIEGSGDKHDALAAPLVASILETRPRPPHRDGTADSDAEGFRKLLEAIRAERQSTSEERDPPALDVSLSDVTHVVVGAREDEIAEHTIVFPPFGSPPETIAEATEETLAFDETHPPGPGYWVNITLPNDSILTIYDSNLETTILRPATVEPKLPPAANPERGCLPVNTIAIAAIALLLVAIAAITLALTSGDDEPADSPDDTAAGESDSSTIDDPPVDPSDDIDLDSAVPDAAAVGDPCSFMDTTAVQAITGTPHFPDYTAPTTGNRHVCFLRGTDATGDPFLQIELQRSNDSESYTTFTEAFPEATATPLDWPGEGVAEVRAGSGFAVLWAEIIPPDALGRRVHIQVNLGNPMDTVTGFPLDPAEPVNAIRIATDQVAAVGELLRDGVLAAQP